jgi:acyl-CoA thioesterase II
VPKIASLLRAFTLEPAGAGAWRAPNAESGHGVVFGGQLMGQSIVAALAGQEGKAVKTLHTVFARAASYEEPVALAVDRMSEGRTFASSAVTIEQAGRLCTRSLVLMSADEPDFIRHAEPVPKVPGPEECPPSGEAMGDWEIRIVGGVDVNDPAKVGPPVLDVWTRFVGAPADPALNQALLAFATDGFLIATAMRPHEGVGQAQAHRTVSTGVISHTLTFHEPCAAGEWLLLSHRSAHAGHGRCYGSANVFTAGGALVASFVQDGMIRPLAASRGGRTL